MTTMAASTASAAEISLRRTCSPSATASQEAYNRMRSSVTVAIAVLRPAPHQRLPRTYLKFNHWGNDRSRGVCELLPDQFGLRKACAFYDPRRPGEAPVAREQRSWPQIFSATPA